MPARFYLREMRERAKLTQAELAARIGVEDVTIARWENYENQQGEIRVPNLDALAALAEALNCHISDFFFDPAAPRLDNLTVGATPEQIDRARKTIEASGILGPGKEPR